MQYNTRSPLNGDIFFNFIDLKLSGPFSHSYTLQKCKKNLFFLKIISGGISFRRVLPLNAKHTRKDKLIPYEAKSQVK